MACTRGRRQPFSCGHKGFGQICRRCWQADRMLEQSEKLKGGDATAKAKAAELKTEAARLKVVPKKAGQVSIPMPAAPEAV